MDQDSAFMSSLMNYLFKKVDIKIKTVASSHQENGSLGHVHHCRSSSLVHIDIEINRI